MRKIFIILLLIPYFNNANADFEKLAEHGSSVIFARDCSDFVDLYKKADDPDDIDLITNMFGMAFLGMITGYNFASHIKTPESGYGVETFRTDPKFLFQYLVNECQKNPDKDMIIPMFEYINEQVQLSNTYNW
jgi:hypothetical protein